MVWYTDSITKACSSRSLVYSIASTYCGSICSTSSLSKSSSHFSWLCWYWSEIDHQVEPLSMDLVSIPPYTSWYVCNVSLDLYKVPCLWVDGLIFVLSHFLHCKFVGVPLSALSPHPSNLTFKGSTLINNLARTLGCLITLLMNASRTSIITIDGILYLADHFFVLGILGMVYCTLFEIWNCTTSFANDSYLSTTFLSLFYCMATWSNCLYKL